MKKTVNFFRKNRRAIAIRLIPIGSFFLLWWSLENWLISEPMRRLEQLLQFLTGNWPNTDQALA
jgi:hypothetical protein